MIHELKTLPEFFQAVVDRKKKFELRRDDRNFAVGDKLILKEFDRTNFTGREVHASVAYKLVDCPQYGLRRGYCILGFASAISFKACGVPVAPADKTTSIPHYAMGGELLGMVEVPLNPDAEQRLQGFRVADEPAAAEPLYRVMRTSNHGDEMVDEIWSSLPMSKDAALARAIELNNGARDDTRYWYTARPETHKLYVFEP